MAAPRRAGQTQSYGVSSANNKQAQLTNAYQELGKELCSDKLKVVGGYTLGRVIGEGTFGSVHLATHRLTGTRCAIKKIPKSSTPQLTREIHHHRRLHHANIVHLYEIIATETHIWLVTELCSGGELFDYLVERGRMLEGEARRLFGDLAVAVGWMHRQGVVHRDLKLENVLLDGELRIKLGDLGFAREWHKGRLMETFCGTTGYASPEMLSGRKYLGQETDIWSLGIIMYILLCGGLPFDDDDERAMKDLILKGEYEEPDWLSEEARSLISGMLQQDPSKRLTIEQILTHPWFKMTIVDRLQSNHGDSHSVPPSPLPASPSGGGEFFAESFGRTPSGSRHIPHLPAPSPLSSNAPQVPQAESEPSEASADPDSEPGRTGSTSTTPPTDDEEGAVHRVNSAEFSATEKALELLHPNSSQSTIRQAKSISSSGGNTKTSLSTTFEGQQEEEEEGEEEDITERLDEPGGLPKSDDHSLHLPVAGHSRTPSRTKRRSVSSTLSVERRLSHHSMSGQWQRYHPDDYLAKLNEERPPHFSTPSEKHLLTQLNDMGMDTGQLRHSVECDACDSSAAMWWILRAKQAERGETDEVVTARAATAAKKREKAAAYAREERRKARESSANEQTPEARTSAVTFKEESSSIPVTPTFNIMDLGAPIAGPSRQVVASPEPAYASADALNAVRSPPFELKPLPNTISSEASIVPSAPPRDTGHPSPEASPGRTKTRSPSMSMLQRATSVWVGKKMDEPDISHQDRRSVSPTKLQKPPPKTRMMPRSESDNTLLAGPSRQTQPISSTSASPISTPQRDRLNKVQPGAAVDLTEDVPAQSPDTSVTAEQLVAGPSNKPKSTKRDSLWTTFRHLFNEDKRRKRNSPGSPLSAEVKIAPAVVLSRGANARAPYINRTPAAPSSRRASLDGRPPLYSRRSSSINSRRSSFDGPHLHEQPDFANLHRRASGRSHGSQTPTSDREYVDYPSRPGSAHSLQRGNSRRSSMSMRSPSLHSHSDNASARFKNGTPASPLHNYRRRAPGGHDSSRVRHIRVIPETQILRPSSVASSIKSNASSRASSAEGRRDSEHDDNSESASLRSQRRHRKGDGRNHSLAQQIYRTRSPLSSHPAQREQKATRDVFQKSKDDDWISEDEDEFAGGLGQGTVGKMWVNGTRAAAFPNANAKLPTPTARRRGRRTSSEEKEARDEPKGLGIVVEASAPASASGRPRRGLPSGRSAAPVIEEEEEDEE